MSSQTKRGKLLMGFASTPSSKVLIPGNPEYATWVLLSRNTTNKFWKILMKASYANISKQLFFYTNCQRQFLAQLQF